MTIGIDIDNTLVDTQSAMYDFIYADERKTELLENIKELENGNTKHPIVKYFYKRYAIEIFKNAKLINGAKEVLLEIANKGHRIVFITLRGNKESFYCGSEEITIDFLKAHNIPYSDIVFNSKNKMEICSRKKVDIMLDDSIRVISRLNSTHTKGILFNRKNKPNYGVTQVHSWEEFLNYLNK